MVKAFFSAIAPVLSADVTILCVVAALALWAVLSGLRLWRATSRFASALERATARIRRSENAVAFAGDYEAVRNALRDEPLIKTRWEEYAPSLVLPHGGDLKPIRSTVRPSLWFDLSMLREADLRYHAALPNLLVGMGLLFTFLGLAVALSTAGGVVSGTAEARSAEMEKLLNAASFKFVTSLAGLAFSISYALFRKSRLRAVEGALNDFHVALEERIELLTPVQLQQDTNVLLRKQTDHLEKFSTELAINIGQAFDEKLDGRLGQYIEPLTQAMERLANRETADREGAIERMLERFLAGLQAGTGDRMQDVAGTLERLGSRLDGVQTGLVEATTRMSDAADDMGRRMGEGADAALGRVNEGMTSLVTSLRDMVEATRGAGAEAGQAIADRLEAAAGQVAAALERAGQDSSGALGRGVEEAVGRIVAATEGMRTELAAVAVSLRTEAAAGGEALRAGGAAGAASLQKVLDGSREAMTSALLAGAESVRRAGETAGSALERGGSAAGERLNEAGDAFGDRAAALASRVAALTSASEGFGLRLADLDRATRDAATPLVAAAADLRAAGEGARASIERLDGATRSLEQSIGESGRALSRLEAAGVATERLAETVRTAAARFEGLDRDLEAVFRQLQSGLTEFAAQVANVTKQTDANLGQAANRLADLVLGLTEAVEDLGDHMPSSNGARSRPAGMR